MTYYNDREADEFFKGHFQRINLVAFAPTLDLIIKPFPTRYKTKKYSSQIFRCFTTPLIDSNKHKKL